MQVKSLPMIDIPAGLLDALRNFPLEREVEHCGVRMTVGPFDFYAQCPQCGVQIKLRSFSAVAEIEDVFDAVFEWMNTPGAAELAQQRQAAIQNEAD